MVFYQEQQDYISVQQSAGMRIIALTVLKVYPWINKTKSLYNNDKTWIITNTYYQIFINGKRVVNELNEKPKIFNNVKYYASDPWYVPGKAFKLGPENEFATVMDQWFDWNLKSSWCGDDGFDYLAALPNLSLDTLMMAAAKDSFIAPERGCRRIFDALSSSDKTFALCSKDQGFAEDYTHARIISSRSAATDIWPRIADWLRKR